MAHGECAGARFAASDEGGGEWCISVSRYFIMEINLARDDRARSLMRNMHLKRKIAITRAVQYNYSPARWFDGWMDGWTGV